MLETLIVALTSWVGVYTVCAAPAVFMGASFVMGDCFVAEALDAISGKTADRKGRLCVISSYSLLALQLFLFPQVRGMCMYDGVCDVFDGLFWAAWVGTAVLYTWCLLSSPHSGGSGDRCRRCGVVAGRDHHCILINSCVGRRNYIPFIALLLCAMASAVNILVSTVGWVWEYGSVVHQAAYLISAVYAVGSALLLLFQGHLAIRGITTIEYIRASK